MKIEKSVLPAVKAGRLRPGGGYPAASRTGRGRSRSARGGGGGGGREREEGGVGGGGEGGGRDRAAIKERGVVITEFFN